MLDKNTLDSLAQRLAEALPSDLHALKGDMEKTFHGVLRSALSSLDLVSRDEFDAQSAVLARTREKLEQLSVQVAELEQRLSAPKD